MLSVVIPSYEMFGRGEENLEFCLYKLSEQTYKDFEVVVTDHSLGNELRTICTKWSLLLNIKYIRNEDNRGSSSANVNKAIRNSSGELIKVLCQDDYLLDASSLEKTVKGFDHNKQWLVSAYYHTNDRINLFNPHTPYFTDDLVFNNKIGTHSCLTIKNEDLIYFDDNLIWFMDGDYYKRLTEKFGSPTILTEFTFVQMLWPGQVTNTLATQERRNAEQEYLLKKYGNH